MNREEKSAIVDSLTASINEFGHLYVTDTSALSAGVTSELRKLCFENNITLIVAKNTLLKLALEKAEGEYQELYNVLKGPTSIMLSNSSSEPGKLIKNFRKKNDKPILKGAYVEESVYIGDNQIDALANIKSKEELIGELIALLQSPIKNVLSQLQSGGNILAGVVKTLSERE